MRRAGAAWPEGPWVRAAALGRRPGSAWRPRGGQGCPLSPTFGDQARHPHSCRAWIFPLLSPCSGASTWLGWAPPHQDPGWQQAALEVWGVHPSLCLVAWLASRHPQLASPVLLGREGWAEPPLLPGASGISRRHGWAFRRYGAGNDA